MIPKVPFINYVSTFKGKAGGVKDTKKCPESVQKVSRKCPESVQKVSRKFQNVSRKCPNVLN